MSIFLNPNSFLSVSSLEAPKRVYAVRTPEEMAAKWHRINSIRLEWYLIDFIHLVKTAKSELSSEVLKYHCSRLSIVLNKKGMENCETKRMELTPELIAVFKEEFADLHGYLRKIRGRCISFEVLKNDCFDLCDLAKRIDVFRTWPSRTIGIKRKIDQVTPFAIVEPRGFEPAQIQILKHVQYREGEFEIRVTDPNGIMKILRKTLGNT